MPEIHRAEPFEAWAANELGTACRHCGSQIKRVPGGSGPVWVHADTGAVVGPGEPVPVGPWRGIFDV